jgi:transcription elongation GreA/GreB family factor
MRTDRHRSLGIVTLNQKQRDLIAEEFEYAVSQDRQAQAYIDAWKEKNDGLEEFFIKNLENVQGDERDVIFIGTVYGPESNGARVTQRFGPINGLAGKRRLNVLFSRAKEKIVTFSSMTSADIVAEENGNAGAYMLKRWLEYAAVGMLDGGLNTPKEPGSDFEVYVMDQIRAMGCEPVPQVGVAGYFIDIGVRHPEWPYGFVLGVECDGASYHSAKSARDRDRLRQEVLERLGWHFHRIWSTDWFNNPRQEGERLRDVIAKRMMALRAREAEFSARSVPEENAKEIRLPEPTLQEEFALSARSERSSSSSIAEDGGVAVGDTVRVRHLTDDRNVVVITISSTKSDPSRGIVHREAPIAKALLGANEGDEVEVLSGSYVRPAVVETIVRGKDVTRV